MGAFGMPGPPRGVRWAMLKRGRRHAKAATGQADGAGVPKRFLQQIEQGRPTPAANRTEGAGSMKGNVKRYQISICRIA